MRTRELKTGEEWLDIVKEYEKSGKSLRIFCEGKDFNDYQLRYWRKKFGFAPKKEVSKLEESPGFARVRASSVKSAGSSGIVIRYNRGTTLELPENYNLNQLIKLVKLGEC